MAKMINLQCLIFTPFLSTSTHTSKSLFPSQSFAISTKPISKTRFARSPIRPSLDSKASKTAAVPDNIMNVLGEVGIFSATGEPVKFKDLWDQMREWLLLHYCNILDVFDGMFVFKGNQLLYVRKDEGTGDPCSLG